MDNAREIETYLREDLRKVAPLPLLGIAHGQAGR
jgi:hypothetical protein